jgi:hypothetical protein
MDPYLTASLLRNILKATVDFWHKLIMPAIKHEMQL